MRYITPTGYAEGRHSLVEPRRLGSTQAVFDALLEAAANHPLARPLVLLGSRAELTEAAELVAAAGPLPVALDLVSSVGCPDGLWELPPGAVIGVTPDAFTGMFSAQWAATQKVLAGGRFALVLWG